ncbi:hypothetical protein ACLOJK_004214 [Asimina triloba]
MRCIIKRLATSTSVSSSSARQCRSNSSITNQFKVGVVLLLHPHRLLLLGFAASSEKELSELYTNHNGGRNGPCVCMQLLLPELKYNPLFPSFLLPFIFVFSCYFDDECLDYACFILMEKMFLGGGMPAWVLGDGNSHGQGPLDHATIASQGNGWICEDTLSQDQTAMQDDS